MKHRFRIPTVEAVAKAKAIVGAARLQEIGAKFVANMNDWERRFGPERSEAIMFETACRTIVATSQHQQP